MNNKYIRVEQNHEAVKARRDRQRARAENNSDLHENTAVKPVFGPRSIQDGIGLAALRNWKDTKGGLVYIDNNTYNPTTTPSHNIDLLIQSLPKEVGARYATNEDGSPIMLPFTLPLYWQLSKGKNTSDIAKPYFYQLALSELETLSHQEYRLNPFTFTLSRALVERIQGQNKEMVDFLRDRIQKALKEALQRQSDNQVCFWFALEMARRGQPHIQGSMLIRPDEQDAVRRAFYKVNCGNKMTADEKRDCLRLGRCLTKREELFIKRGRLYTDLNWADYNLKERATTRMHYNNLRPIVAVSQPLTKHAKDYYNRLRKEFNRQQ